MIATQISLSDLRPPEGQEPKPGFEAAWQGQPVIVTAVLERTAVVLLDGEKHLARKTDVLVDPATVAWVEVVTPGHRYRQAILDAPAVRRARATMAADQGAIVSGYHRFSPAGAGRALLTGTCSSCGRGIRASNATGICVACRTRCGCGGPKGQESAMCRDCRTVERAQRSREG